MWGYFTVGLLIVCAHLVGSCQQEQKSGWAFFVSVEKIFKEVSLRIAKLTHLLVIICFIQVWTQCVFDRFSYVEQVLGRIWMLSTDFLLPSDEFECFRQIFFVVRRILLLSTDFPLPKRVFERLLLLSTDFPLSKRVLRLILMLSTDVFCRQTNLNAFDSFSFAETCPRTIFIAFDRFSIAETCPQTTFHWFYFIFLPKHSKGMLRQRFFIWV